MTMKKRFLGLALAAMVAVPATTAYAADSQTITMGKNETSTHNVTVKGSVNNKTGQAPEGMISVELPTKMAFSVDQEGSFSGSTYNVVNKGQIGVDVSVASFTESNTSGGIEVLPKTDMTDLSTKYRNQVSLTLTSGSNEVDLGGFGKTGLGDLLTVNADSTGSIVLQGNAGTKAAEDGADQKYKDVDANGVAEDFTLVFNIKKTK